MMKFYYATETCSMACHIVLEELGIPHTPIEVSFRKKINVKELEEHNPLGAVPTIVTEQGKILTQNVAVLEFLADLKPGGKLLADRGNWERNEVMSWVGFIASDLQRGFDPFFQAEEMTQSEPAQKEIVQYTAKKLREKLEYINHSLSGREYIVGKQFTIADAYLFTILGWTKWLDVRNSDYPHITAYMKRVFERPAVQSVLKKDDLLDYIQ